MALKVADLDLVLALAHQHTVADLDRSRSMAAIVDARVSVVRDGARALGVVTEGLDVIVQCRFQLRCLVESDTKVDFADAAIEAFQHVVRLRIATMLDLKLLV